MKKANSTKVILVSTGAVLMMLMAAALWGLSAQYSQQISQSIKIQSDNTTNLFNAELDKSAALISELLIQIQADNQIVAAWEDRDRQQLLRFAKPMMDQYLKAYGVSHLCFIEPDMTCFLRTHEPDRFGDKTQKIVIKRVAESGITGHGIELCKYGTFTLCVARPWMINGELIGYVGMGEGVDVIVSNLKSNINVDLIMTIDKKYLDRMQWETRVELDGHDWYWDQYTGRAVVLSTLDQLPPDLVKIAHSSQHLHDSQDITLSADDRVLISCFVHLKDAGNRHVGDFYILQDITEAMISYQSMIALILFVGLGLGGLLIVQMRKRLSLMVVPSDEENNDLSDSDEPALTREQLLVSNQRLMTAQEIAKIGSWELNPASRQLYASPEAFRICGFERTSDSIPFTRIREVIHVDDRKKFFGTLKQALKDGESYVVDFRIKPSADKRERIISSRVNVVCDENGKTSKLEGIIQDITDDVKQDAQKNQLQDKLDRAERMESLGMMAGGVAHDLNNMLGPIVGYPELLLRKMPSDGPHVKHIRRIGNAAKEAADVIKDLLTLARRGRYEMKQIDLSEVVKSYLDSPGLLQLEESQPEIEIKTDLAKCKGSIFGSSVHLGKVVMNLVVNAFDAMPTGGRVTISIESRYLEKLLSGFTRIEPSDYLILRIADTGMGIPSESIGRIFEPYYSKKKMGRSGSGLGLSVVYGIIKDHNGYYDVFSTVGESTEFVLYFPLCKEDVVPDTPSEDKYDGQETILVVDDTAVQLEVAQTLLSSQGYEVSAVGSGVEALAFIKNHPVDLVILDMVMDNGLDGLDTYREIARIYPGQRAILVTGASTSERLQQAQALTGGPTLKKPFTLDGISRVVRQALDAKPVETV